MKCIAHKLVLFLIALCFSVLATAQTQNDYLPGTLSPKSDPRVVEAINLLSSAKIKERDEGLAQLITLSENNDTASQALLALSFARNDDNSDTALAKSREYLETCVEKDPGYSDCQIWLGLYYLYGTGGKVDKKASTKAFQASADTGSPIGQWHLAMAYLKGNGVKKSQKTAFILIDKSARQDYPPALVSYGTMKALGQGTKKDAKLAFLANARAAHFGDSHAIYVVAVSYEKGLGVKPDLDMADTAFFLAAENGFKPAMKVVQKGLMNGTKKQQQTLWENTRRNRKKLETVLANASLPD